jgi:chromosome segregation ATPase
LKWGADRWVANRDARRAVARESTDAGAKVRAAELATDVALRKATDEAALDQIASLRTTVRALEEDFHRRDSEREGQIRESNELHVRTIAALNERIAGLEAKILVLEAANGDLVSANGELQQQKRKDDQTIALLRAQVRRIQKDNDALQRAVNAAASTTA